MGQSRRKTKPSIVIGENGSLLCHASKWSGRINTLGSNDPTPKALYKYLNFRVKD